MSDPKESLAILDQKEVIIEAEIENHTQALHDAKLRLKKVRNLRAQLCGLLGIPVPEKAAPVTN